MKSALRGIGVAGLVLATVAFSLASPATVGVTPKPTNIKVGPPNMANQSKVTVTTDKDDPWPAQTVPQVTMQFSNPGGSSSPLQFDVDFGKPEHLPKPPGTTSYTLAWNVTKQDILDGLDAKLKDTQTAITNANTTIAATTTRILALQDIDPRTPAQEQELQALIVQLSQLNATLGMLNTDVNAINMIKSQVQAGNYTSLSAPKVSILYQKLGLTVVTPPKKPTTIQKFSAPLSPPATVK